MVSGWLLLLLMREKPSRQALRSPHIVGLFCPYRRSLLTLVGSAQALRMAIDLGFKEGKDTKSVALYVRSLKEHRKMRLKDFVRSGAVAGAIDQLAQETDPEVRTDMAVYLFGLLVEEEAFEEAAALQERWGLKDHPLCPVVDASLIASARLEREARDALSLALPSKCKVRFVDSVASARQASRTLRHFLDASSSRLPVTQLAEFSALEISLKVGHQILSLSRHFITYLW